MNKPSQVETWSFWDIWNFGFDKLLVRPWPVGQTLPYTYGSGNKMVAADWLSIRCKDHLRTTMPSCCWSNSSGLCGNCRCRKTGSHCRDCLPMHKYQCVNTHDKVVEHVEESHLIQGLFNAYGWCPIWTAARLHLWVGIQIPSEPT